MKGLVKEVFLLSVSTRNMKIMGREKKNALTELDWIGLDMQRRKIKMDWVGFDWTGLNEDFE